MWALVGREIAGIGLVPIETQAVGVAGQGGSFDRHLLRRGAGPAIDNQAAGLVTSGQSDGVQSQLESDGIAGIGRLVGGGVGG